MGKFTQRERVDSKLSSRSKLIIAAYLAYKALTLGERTD